MRDRPSELCDECLLHQPGIGPDRALYQPRQIREQGLRIAETPRREGRRAAPRQARRQIDGTQRGASQLSRPATLWSFQARALPVLTGVVEPARLTCHLAPLNRTGARAWLTPPRLSLLARFRVFAHHAPRGRGRVAGRNESPQ